MHILAVAEATHGASIASLHAACALYNTEYIERLVPETYYTPPGIRDASTEIDGDGDLPSRGRLCPTMDGIRIKKRAPKPTESA